MYDQCIFIFKTVSFVLHQRKKSHKPSVMTESLYKKPGSTAKAVRHEPGEKTKRGTRGYNDMIRLQTASHQIDTLPDKV